MKSFVVSLDDVNISRIVETAEDFLLIYKPPKIHSTPGKGQSIAEIFAEQNPDLLGLPMGECGLIHRLDYETHGLLLAARNEKAYNALREEQRQGKIIKYYGALISEVQKKKHGFPLYAGDSFSLNAGAAAKITSSFRPFGPGRREVRPVPAGTGTGKIYITEIIKSQKIDLANTLYVKVRLVQGFRHQIRCHLAWAGFPILNDPLYHGINSGKGFLALRAEGIEFVDPGSGEELRYNLPPLARGDI